MAETTTTTTEKKPVTVQDQFNAREAETQKGIGSAYDSNLTAQKQALLNAYNTNTQAQAQAKQGITGEYQKGLYDVGVQNNRNAGNVTRFADVRGVNSQPGSQLALGLNNARAQSTGAMAFAQQQAMEEQARQQQLLTQGYQNQVAAAIADNDYKRAAALLDDYNNNKKWQDQQAQILASYGNFDPYKDLYGEDAANGMRNVWLRQNPDTAYKIGAMDPYTYHDITGRWPAGFNPWGGGGYGWYGGGSPDDDDVINPSGGGKPQYIRYNNGRTVTREMPAGRIQNVYVPSRNSSGRSTNTRIQVVK